MPGPSRRDFLKFGSVVSGALAAARFLPRAVQGASATAASAPNIIILLFDAMSAKNLSLYGYRRKTTPNLERFAARATVYDQHYSAGNFTVPGTASLLTGLYPWSHRAINMGGLIAAPQVEHNLFEQMGAGHYRLAYSQNAYPNYFFGQFERHIERVLSPDSFSLLHTVLGSGFPDDLVNSHRAFDDFLLQDGEQPSASLVLGLAHSVGLYEAIVLAKKQGTGADLTSTGNYPIEFRLKEVFDGMLKTITGLPQPFLAYLHTWSPHSPYHPTAQFTPLFADKWAPEPKPDDPLGEHQLDKLLASSRRLYDRYIANVDFEFGRLL